MAVELSFGQRVLRIAMVTGIVLFMVFGLLLVGSVANRGWTMLEKASACQHT